MMEKMKKSKSENHLASSISADSCKDEFISSSPAETEDFAAKFAKKISPGTVIALFGELGSGKSVFARGFARGLGITEPVQSPTFVIVHEYRIRKKSVAVKFLFHLDLYRIENAESAFVFGMDEYLKPEAAITIIEWAERIEKQLPSGTIKIRLRHVTEKQRGILSVEL